MTSQKKWQIRIFTLCWLAYALAYLGRINLSIAIPSMEQSLSVTRTQMGLLGSLFFWIYGIGQLINGYIGDKKSSKRMIFIGLFASSLINIFFGLTTHYLTMCLLWALNGYCLSMLWGPMTKALANWFSPSSRSRIAIAISTSMVGGFLFAWGAVGFILSYLDWYWGFFIPGIVIFIYAIIFAVTMKDHPNQVHSDLIHDEVAITVEHNEEKELSLLQLISKTKLWYVVIACYSQGMIKDGISLWGPTFIMETHNLALDSTVQFIIFIPIMNFLGMFIAGKLNEKYKDREKLTAIILFILGIIMLIGLIKFGPISPVFAVLFLGLSSAMMYGANTILLGVIPLTYAKYNKTSSVAGFLDFNSYMAAGISSLLTGFLVQIIGWNGILLFWLMMSLLAIASLFINLKSERTV